jgi:flagellar biosynthesis protein FlhA
MLNSLQKQGEELTLAIAPDQAMEINNKLAEAWRSAMEKAYESVVLLCDSRQRAALAAMTERALPRLPVLAYDEIEVGTQIETVETVSIGLAGQMTEMHSGAVAGV